MSNVVDLLERMGRDAQLRHASQGEVELALAEAQIDPELQAAIIAKNQRQLEALLGRGSLCCLMLPAKEGEDDDSEESPSQDGEEITLHHAFRTATSAG
ncbi:MAG: hypothetical protein KGJ32_00815 [Xanthomonadaceae bacterium]|nr:hypothetical protein [Xanthomonadaceae bacterium]